MKKIPTLYVRSEEDRSRVTSEVTPGCEWVFEVHTAECGEVQAVATPTVKYDGTCVMVDEDRQPWARREVKPGKEAPDGWVEVDHDERTGKRVGWEPMANSGFAKFYAEAVEHAAPAVGTHELCGPKINGNPHSLHRHRLMPHGALWVPMMTGAPVDMEAALAELPYEGIVWWHPDGRRAKIKRRDFGLPWPVQ